VITFTATGTPWAAWTPLHTSAMPPRPMHRSSRKGPTGIDGPLRGGVPGASLVVMEETIDGAFARGQGGADWAEGKNAASGISVFSLLSLWERRAGEVRAAGKSASTAFPSPGGREGDGRGDRGEGRAGVKHPPTP